MTARELLDLFVARKIFFGSLVAVFLIWLGVGGYLFYTSRYRTLTQGQPAETQQVGPSGGETQEGAAAPGTPAVPTPKFTPTTRLPEWPVHQNTEFSYQISYPEGTTPRDQGAVGTTVLNLTNFIATDQEMVFPVVGVKIVTTPYAELEERMMGLAEAGYTVQEAVIGGVKGLKVSGKRSGTEETVYEAIFPAKTGENTFRIITATEPGQEAHLEVFDQMVESFTFL